MPQLSENVKKAANIGNRNGLMATYTTEIMPYGLRAKGFTWLNFCVTLSLFFSTSNLVVPIIDIY